MSQILDCYKSVLTAFNLAVDEGDMISQHTPTGVMVPLKVEGRRLVLPTKTWMKKGFGEDYLPFHPLCEVMSREGTSPVVQMLQRQAKAVITYNAITLVAGLLDVAIDKDTHKDLPIECTDFLKKLANADKTTKDLFEKLLSAASKKNRLVTIYLKNGGKFDGQKVNRSAIIRFPILEDLQADSPEVLGVKIPKKQKPTLVALFKLIVPFGDNVEEYSAGSNSRVAPYFTALLTAYHKIITVLNQSINTYGEKLHIAVRPIELYALSDLDKFPKIYNELPAFSGNEGSTKEEPEEATDTKPVVKSVTVSNNSAPQEQISRNAPVTKAVEVSTSKGTASMADFMNATNPQPQYPNYSQPQQNNLLTLQPQNGFNQPTGFNGFQQPNSNYAPMQFNQPQNPYAPVQMNAPWNAPQQQQQYQSNPFMAATNSGRVGSNGATGLI